MIQRLYFSAQIRDLKELLKNTAFMRMLLQKSLKEAGLKDLEGLEKRIHHMRRAVRRLESQMRGGNLALEDEEDEDSKQVRASLFANVEAVPRIRVNSVRPAFSRVS